MTKQPEKKPEPAPTQDNVTAGSQAEKLREKRQRQDNAEGKRKD